MVNWHLRIIETVDELKQVEVLQRIVWPGSETDIVPVHLLVATINNGGLVIGAYTGEKFSSKAKLVGFVFGFPGLTLINNLPGLKHVSHMLAVHTEYRDSGLGFALKRAQWQMVRHQGIGLITWTYDPLLSRNANLNIRKLGAVSNRYRREVYGQMRDGLNTGLPSDRLEADWWVKTRRVERRLSRRSRRPLDLAHYFAAGAEIINPTTSGENGWAVPGETMLPSGGESSPGKKKKSSLILLEIPFDFQKMRSTNIELAREWRMHTRMLFEGLFQQGYIVTDFVRLEGSQPRSFYVFSHGESTL